MADNTPAKPKTAAKPKPRRKMPLKHRIFIALCFAAAVVVLVFGLSRGNPKGALISAGVLIGYALLQDVSMRLTPTARLVSGQEADGAERMVHYTATKQAGQAAMVVAGVGAIGLLVLDWAPGLWLVVASGAIVLTFVVSLLIHDRAR